MHMLPNIAFPENASLFITIKTVICEFNKDYYIEILYSTQNKRMVFVEYTSSQTN